MFVALISVLSQKALINSRDPFTVIHLSLLLVLKPLVKIGMQTPHAYLFFLSVNDRNNDCSLLSNDNTNVSDNGPL